MKAQQKQRVYHKLKELGITYVKHEHKAVFTCEEADKYSEGIEGEHCKNLFLRNAKGNRQYLVILGNDKRADLGSLKKILGEKRLSFGSDKRLMEYMGIESGAVSVFNLINDVENIVEIVIDESLGNAEKINFHPNDNTETLTISYRDFLKFLKAMGKEPLFIKIG
ncbi:MAG: prolyl-tRNA synthetase associated domain-containing protein [Peptostreptococcaceae bacterium]|nr:prolyl-tRNA synthetase associated domain-containing protein [Peptostreptococcaceae bacterium]